MFFDNLQSLSREKKCIGMTHLKGPLLEESHYYPFGTEMSGISTHSLPSYVPTVSREAKRIGNRCKANGGADCVPRAIANREYGDGEWSNNTGLEMYETFYRSYNAQIGRFMQGDPMMEATVSMSGYVFSGNNPVMFTDLLGDLSTAGLYSIINHLMSSENGGQWSANDPERLYLYNDQFTSAVFGGLSAGGNPFSFSEEGGRGSGQSNVWDDNEIEKYRDYVSTVYDAYYKYAGGKYTCEDLALHILIYFASANKLPVVIKNDTNPKGFRLENFGNAYDYFEAVATSTAARDLPGWGNVIERNSPSPGDLIVLFNDIGVAHHIQVVTKVTSNAIYAIQGNFEPWYIDMFRWSNNPFATGYHGTDPQTGYYSRLSGSWHNSSLNTSTRDLLYSKRTRFFSWNFWQFNN